MIRELFDTEEEWEAWKAQPLTKDDLREYANSVARLTNAVIATMQAAQADFLQWIQDNPEPTATRGEVFEAVEAIEIVTIEAWQRMQTVIQTTLADLKEKK